MAGGVNNDNLLFAVCALLLALLARAFRRGLTPRLGVMIGLTVTAGVLTKPPMFGVVPGAGLGLLFLAWRGYRAGDRAPLRGTVLAGLACLGTTLAWYAIDATVFGRVPSDAAQGLNSGSQPTSIFSNLSYLWQFYLPKLPFMGEKFPGYPRYPVWDVLIQGFIGRFGYFQYGFPVWAYRLGFWFLTALAVVAVVAVARARAVRRRWEELCCYLAMVIGLVGLTAFVGYRYKLSTGANFEQIRYFFPVLALYGAVVAVAARGFGRRWGRPVGAFLVMLAMGQSLLAMLVTIARYYA
jgi:hypothetical protein